MKTITINLFELAKEVVDNFSFDIADYDHKIADSMEDEISFEEFIENYVTDRTPDNCIIMEPALQTLYDELAPFITSELQRRLSLQTQNFDTEDIELLAQLEKQYEVEQEND